MLSFAFPLQVRPAQTMRFLVTARDHGVRRKDARQNCALIVSGGPSSVDEALDGDLPVCKVEEQVPRLL